MNDSEIMSTLFALRELVRAEVRKAFAEQLTERSAGTELLTVAEAAAIAKLKPPTIRAWVKEGRLQARRVGPRLRILRSDLETALAAGTRTRDEKLSPEARARRDANLRLNRRT